MPFGGSGANWKPGRGGVEKRYGWFMAIGGNLAGATFGEQHVKQQRRLVRNVLKGNDQLGSRDQRGKKRLTSRHPSKDNSQGIGSADSQKVPEFRIQLSGRTSFSENAGTSLTGNSAKPRWIR